MSCTILCLVIFGGSCAAALIFLYLHIFWNVRQDKSCSETSGPSTRRPILSEEGILLGVKINGRRDDMESRSQILGAAPENPNLTADEKRKYVMEKLLLYKTHCGQQHWDDYLHTENETSGHEAHIYEFPWLVSFVNGDYRCSGFLISNRYFITTEECFQRGYESADKAVVLVGVHHIQNRTSCIRLPYADDCTNDVVPLRLQRAFTINSIVLVELAKTVLFSYFVRPICLPLEDYERPKTGDVVVMSGWGRLLHQKDYVSVKKRNHQQVVSLNDNEDVTNFPNSIRTFPLQNSTTACLGDEGSPTMYMHEDTWFAAGVTIAGSMCRVNQPVSSIAITPEVANQILDTIYEQSSMARIPIKSKLISVLSNR